jgi:hypothetical protein
LLVCSFGPSPPSPVASLRVSCWGRKWTPAHTPGEEMRRAARDLQPHKIRRLLRLVVASEMRLYADRAGYSMSLQISLRHGAFCDSEVERPSINVGVRRGRRCEGARLPSVGPLCLNKTGRPSATPRGVGAREGLVALPMRPCGSERRLRCRRPRQPKS